MDVHNFLANLLCLFLPLLCLDAWQLRKSRADTPYATPWTLLSALVVAAVSSSLFNFSISTGIRVNLSIVALTLAFFLLPLPIAWLTVLLYIAAQVLISAALLSHRLLDPAAWHTIAVLLPHALWIVLVYVGLMTLCSYALAHQRFSWRGCGFVAALLCYSLLDYAYVAHNGHLPGFNSLAFASFVLFYSLTFIVTARLVVAARNAHERRLDAAQSERLRLIGQLSASVAHELRNPITAVRGFTQLLLEHDYPRAKAVEFLRNMLQEMDKAESMITNYLNLSRPEIRAVKEPVNMAEVTQYAVNLLSPLAQSHQVQLQCQAEPIVVAGSLEPLCQVLINLVKNAIEAHDRPGTVTVTIKRNEMYGEVVVRDTGRGIPQHELQRLGEPYYSTKSHGTGLGLTRVYKVVHELGGRIRIHSQEGEGTT
ncbi:MAG: HAMP domain-containing histidine kinase, partial [Alicyclobacillus sp.]|nr:HAMP domain-containing histidine kinase [Alicyclobacillus sp.]